MSNENANQPAYPTLEQTGNPEAWNTVAGLTKRELIAAMCLKGLLANPSVTTNGVTVDEKVKSAIIHTDELLNQLSKP